MCGKASNFWSRTENLKFMYSQLMTLAKCESKGFSISDASCRVCKYADEYENLRLCVIYYLLVRLQRTSNYRRK